MFAVLKQSLRALSANKARTTLTTLGIVIGIATVILVLSAGAGFRSLIDAQVAAFGSNTLFIETRVPATTKQRAASGDNAYNQGALGVVINTLKDRDLQEIKKIPNVVNDYAMVTGQAVASYRDNQKNALFYGSTAERFEIDKHTLKAGRFYTAAEDVGAAQVAVLGSSLAKNLFNQDDPLGKLIRYGTLNFQVIGVYKPQGDITGVANDAVYIPMNTAQHKMLGIDHFSFVIVQVADIKRADETANQIKLLLRSNHDILSPEKDDFIVQTQAEALATFNTIFGGITILLIAIAAISLIVGGVGIMNIMYVVVTERTAEIGLKKAIGATNKDILREFLTEAVLVTVLGGILGIMLGALLGYVVSIIATAAGLEWAFVVPFNAIALAVAVSATIGIGFGVLPARSAARLDPIEALRYE